MLDMKLLLLNHVLSVHWWFRFGKFDRLCFNLITTFAFLLSKEGALAYLVLFTALNLVVTRSGCYF